MGVFKRPGELGTVSSEEYRALGGGICQVGTPPRGGVSKEEYDQWIVC